MSSAKLQSALRHECMATLLFYQLATLALASGA